MPMKKGRVSKAGSSIEKMEKDGQKPDKAIASAVSQARACCSNHVKKPKKKV